MLSIPLFLLRKRGLFLVCLFLSVGVDQKRKKIYPSLDWRSFLSCVVLCVTLSNCREISCETMKQHERETRSFRRGHTEKTSCEVQFFLSLSPVLQFLSGK